MGRCWVVGAGLSGATCARRLAEAGREVLVTEARAAIGGNAHDTMTAHGPVHCHGPHIFHTNAVAVVAFLSRFTTWRPYVHRVRAYVVRDRIAHYLPVPINETTLAVFGGSMADAFEAIVRPYTRKQWELEPEDLDPSVLRRIQPRASTDDRYFLDTFQAQPADGFTALIGRMLDHPNIAVDTNATVTPAQARAFRGTVIWTGAIDAFFDECLGPLPYRSASFELTVGASARAAPVAVVNYPSPEVDYTRVTDFQPLTGWTGPTTMVCTERPCWGGDPLWPVPTTANFALAKRYHDHAVAEARGVYFLGRLGRYQYLNMDACVAQALAFTSRLLAQ